MRASALFLSVWALAGCGDTLIDRDGITAASADAAAVVLPGADAAVPEGPDAGAQGLSCAADDPCTCTACTTTAQCASGLTCVPGRRKGQDCGFNVCRSGGG